MNGITLKDILENIPKPTNKQDIYLYKICKMLEKLTEPTPAEKVIEDVVEVEETIEPIIVEVPKKRKSTSKKKIEVNEVNEEKSVNEVNENETK